MSDVFDRLLEKAPAKNRDLMALLEDGQLYDNVATEIRGRRIQVRGRWLADFASCNYLGFDLHPGIMAAIPPAVERWGTHPSWARLACSPAIYEELEEGLAKLIGAETTLVLPTISLIAVGLIPAIATKGAAIFADRYAHIVNFDGCRIARDKGASLTSFDHHDLPALEAQLAAAQDAPLRLIVVDGVLSVTGRTPDIPALAAIARKHDAILYVDDAHGFGVIGENPTPERPYGHKGNGVIRHFGLDYDNTLYVAGLSKAYSSLAAFVACPQKLKPYLKTNLTAYVYSGPVPTASLATAVAGLAVNASEGDVLRDRLYAYADAIAHAYHAAGIPTDNDNAFPIVSAYVGSTDNVKRGGAALFDAGINVTMQAYPVVPRDRGVLRATPTAANTWDEVEQLIAAMTRIVPALLR
jgi:8-amino-7-oxononanoate synthase